jgi:deazaflavin-dependent oxidoreductase (nitroreductase family)
MLAFFRAPLLLYRLGLGRLLGHRFLLLTHRGRKSGRPYQSVLEVVHYDPVTRESIVISGWGTRADWYRNIRANPPIAVSTGGAKFQPTFRELTADETYPVVQAYLEKSPPIFRGVAERTLFGKGATAEEMREKARSFVMVAFRPAAD